MARRRGGSFEPGSFQVGLCGDRVTINWKCGHIDTIIVAGSAAVSTVRYREHAKTLDCRLCRGLDPVTAQPISEATQKAFRKLKEGGIL